MDAKCKICGAAAEYRPHLILRPGKESRGVVRMRIGLWLCAQHKDNIDPRKLMTEEQYTTLARQILKRIGDDNVVPPLSRAQVEAVRYENIKPGVHLQPGERLV